MKLVNREIWGELNALRREYPVVSILGPRQSGKTTLAKMLKGYKYCNLEHPENRQLALDDPQSLLEELPLPSYSMKSNAYPPFLATYRILSIATISMGSLS